LNNAESLSLEDENWDYLIILDACRYDYFAKTHGDYLVGHLSKRVSLGSSTPAWFLANFAKYHSDVIYVSGNPHINGKVPVKGIDARKNFSKIVNVWDFGWDNVLGTVPPEAINHAAIETAEAFPNKRLIIHYVQPHSPYLSKDFRGHGFPEPDIADIAQDRVLVGYKATQSGLLNTLDYRLVKTLKYLKILRTSYKFREVLGLPPASPLEATLRKFGTDGLRRAYEENLRIVMQQASRLCRQFLSTNPARRIVITSDHGELLGEKGRFGHPSRSNEPALRVVPWFQVTDTVERTQSADE